MTEIEKYLENPSNVSEGLRLYNQYGKHAALKRNAAKKPGQYHSKICYELGKIKHLGMQVKEEKETKKVSKPAKKKVITKIKEFLR